MAKGNIQPIFAMFNDEKLQKYNYDEHCYYDMFSFPPLFDSYIKLQNGGMVELHPNKIMLQDADGFWWLYNESGPTGWNHWVKDVNGSSWLYRNHDEKWVFIG